MIVIALLQLATPDPAALLANASTRLAATPAEAPADSRYRVDSEAGGVDGKQRALQTDGGQCQVVGARMCTRKPRTWFKTDLPN